MRIDRSVSEVVVTTSSPEETARCGAAVGRVVEPGDTVLLFGDLGAGKTTFVQGMAQSLGAREPVTSPTFTLVHEYHGREALLVHVDPYRLEGPSDIEGLGLFEYLDQGAILAVEWADRLGDLAPEQSMSVHIEQVGEAGRRLRMSWSESRLEMVSAELERA